jgi:hypothetical protein
MNKPSRTFVRLALVSLIAVALSACSSDAGLSRQETLVAAEAERNASVPAGRSFHDFSQGKIAIDTSIPVALVEPLVALPRCDGEMILVSLPDEAACESGKQWVYQPSQRILPPGEMLLVSLKFTGVRVALYPSLVAAKQAGAKVAILTILRKADAVVWQLSDFHKMRRLSDVNAFEGSLSRAIATVKLYAVMVRLDSGQILWKGPVEQVMERTVPSLPLAEGRARVESFAGIGKFEFEAYALRSVVVQAYTQVARTLAKQVDTSLREMR